MADANKDERTLIINDESGDNTTYKVSDMSDEARLLYAKIEIISKESSITKANAEFKLEQNGILQKHYLEAIKPLLSSDEADIEQEV